MRRSLCLVALLATHAHASPLVLDAHHFDAELVTEINMYPNELAQPLSFAPDIWYGVTSRWTVGLVHSHPSVDRFEPGASICVVQLGLKCETTYHGGGIDVRYGALDWLAPRLRLLVTDGHPSAADPIKPAVTLGALLRWTKAWFSITGDPYLQLGLANTDRGNRHQIFLPVMFAARPIERWEVAVHTGFDSPFAAGYCHVPLAISTRVSATEHFDVGAAFGWKDLLGCQPTGKERALFITLAWRQ